MPGKLDHIAINNPVLDRRVALTENDKNTMRALFYKRHLTIRHIARMFQKLCSRRSIQFVLFPERKERVAARAREIKRWTKYNKKDYHTPMMHDHRQYKRKLYALGLLGGEKP